MDDLVEWLRVQLDDDERSGSVAHCADCSRGSEYAGTMYECDVDAARTRVLREVEAKRRVLDEIVPLIDQMDAQIESEWGGGRAVPTGESEPLVKLLALPYSDRPGYREEWRP